MVWVPGSDNRPHRAPDAKRESRYWIRLGAETVDAERSGVLRDLLQQTARVPWDDRIAREATVEDLSEARVREHLREVRSGLLDQREALPIYQRMRLTARLNAHQAPRNVGLLLFSLDPARWFRGAGIEVVQFAGDRDGSVQEERTFGGPLVDQVRQCLNYLKGLSVSHLRKERDHIEVRSWVSYPLPALRETLVNAVYHRGYDHDQVEPTKVFLYPDRIEVTSYPGPVPGIEKHHLAAGAPVPSAPARNRRIGEFLKELRLAEGHLSGIPEGFPIHGRERLTRSAFSISMTKGRGFEPRCPRIPNSEPCPQRAMRRTCGRWERSRRRSDASHRPGMAVEATVLVRRWR